MQRISAMIAVGLVASSCAARAQAYHPAPFVPRADVALGYDYIRSNAPPNQEPKFTANGAFGAATFHLWYWLGVTGEAVYGHATSISNLGQDLNLVTYGGGPRLMGHFGHVTLFAQGIVGAAHAGNSYFPTADGGSTTSANSFAYSAGGGLDYAFTSHWAARVQAEYLHTGFPNGVDNVQQHLSVGAGIDYRFGLHSGHPRGETWKPTPAPLPPAPAVVPAPQAAPAPQPAPAVEAAPMAAVVPPTPSYVPPAPSYEPLVVPPPSVPMAQLSESGTDTDFHSHVKDVLFDYDSYGLKQEQLSAVVQAAVYLKMHPDMKVLIGGFSDERGTVDYNLSLGLKRASAVKEALVAAGIDPSRIMIVSYGKGMQVCTKDDESCWQRNRRAAFMRQPDDLK